MKAADTMTPGPVNEFSTSYDLTTKIISAVVCAAMLIAMAATRDALVAGPLTLIVLLAYAYSPRGYALSGLTLTVKRLVSDVEVPLDGLREVRLAERVDYRGCLRLWGNGGLFGYYGLFRTSRLGKCIWYVTNRSKAVVVATDAKTALFSPDDPASFVAAVRSAALGPGSVAGGRVPR